MGAESTIEWTDATWNPWYGCTPVNEGCAHCYMERWAARAGRPAHKVCHASAHAFRLPLRLEPGHRVFVCSLSDFWHAAADKWRADAFAIMRERPDLTFIIPTKRPQRITAHLPDDWGEGWPNVWLGVSPPTQRWVDTWTPILLAVPAAVHFLSCEPLLGPLNVHRLEGYLVGCLDWIIVGGESGGKARPMHPDWACQARNACLATRTPFFFKQWGEWLPGAEIRTADQQEAYSRARRHVKYPDGTVMARVGRKVAGRTLDGHVWSEYPAHD